jgi:hypothetical protein
MSFLTTQLYNKPGIKRFVRWQKATAFNSWAGGILLQDPTVIDAIERRLSL